MHSFPSQPSVLSLDDESIVLNVLKRPLEAGQFDVTPVSSPHEALRRVSGREFDVIISDQKMPEMTGLAFFAECRKICPNTPRILLTAVIEMTTVMAAINRGGEICRFIRKPWQREELLDAVQAAAN